MELRHLRYFVAVGEEQHYGRASRRLRVAQPALSRQIQDLEEELGFKLFDRLPRGVKLSAAGKLFDRLMHECYRGGLKSPRIVQDGLNEATILSLVSTGLGASDSARPNKGQSNWISVGESVGEAPRKRTKSWSEWQDLNLRTRCAIRLRHSPTSGARFAAAIDACTSYGSGRSL
jgi:hypothetical protein